MVVEPKSLEVYLKKIFSQCCWTMVRLCRMTAKQKCRPLVFNRGNCRRDLQRGHHLKLNCNTLQV